VVLAVALLTIAMVAVLAILGGRLALNIGGAADRAARAIGRGGFIYGRVARYGADTSMYWRAVGFSYIVIAVGLCYFLGLLLRANR
jgi:hypothetical protein